MIGTIKSEVGLAALAALLVISFGLGTAKARRVKLKIGLGTPYLLAGKKHKAYLKVGLKGFKFRKRGKRSSVNVSIVIDKSSSMSGQKIKKAREAAKLAVRMLGPDDIVSIVTYSHVVHVLVPATKARAKREIIYAINRIRAGGTTALFAGVSRGAAEVKKFLDKKRVNRVILLSDGQANVGPSSPAALGSLGRSLIKQGISVTTIGLGSGYNEDLMARLARKSDGNHYFAEKASELVRFFKGEFGAAFSVVAQNININIECLDGIRPIRVLGREADIDGRKVRTMLGQLASDQEKFVLLEVEVPASLAGRSQPLAQVGVSYSNLATQTTDGLNGLATVQFTSSKKEVENNRNSDVMTAVVELIATANNELAIKLRDQGRIRAARKLLLGNYSYLRDNADKFHSKRLREYSVSNKFDADNLTKNWRVQRKRMKAYQEYNINQQMMK